MAREYPRNLPNTYAAEKQAQLAQIAAGEFGRYIAAYWPRDFVFPGLPLSVAYGFASNSSPTENTGLAARPARFAEIGLWGVPAGPSNMNPTNSDTSAQNDWWRLHNDPRVRALLGRSACIGPDCWLPSRGGAADQTAVGFVMLADDLRSVESSLPATLRSQSPSPWRAALIYWAWSAGGAGAARSIARYASSIANVSEGDRFLALGLAIAEEAMGGARWEAQSWSNPAYAWIRTAQKLRAGRLFAPRLGESSAWFGEPSPLEAWVDDALARAAVGASLAGHPSPPAHTWQGASEGGLWAWVGAGAGIAATLVWVWRRKKRRG